MARTASANRSELNHALRLIAVTPDGLPAPELVARAAAAVAGGATAIWLRDRSRHPRELLEVAEELEDRALAGRAWLIVSDRLEVALASGARALQLGSRSLRPADVPSAVPRAPMLGSSAHLPIAGEREAIVASDFVVLGPIFDTPKPGPSQPIGITGLAEIVAGIDRPVVAIGGIDREKAPSLRGIGLTGIAV